MYHIFTCLGLVFFVGAFQAKAQIAFRRNLAIHIQKARSKIILDGKLEEADWKMAEKATDFFQHFPFDSSYANAKTEVRLTYDEQFIYIGAICYNELQGSYLISSLRRDYRGPAYDGFTVVIDPFCDRTNGFVFGVSPFGVQREGLVANGGATSSDLSLSWDNKWYVETRLHPQGWTAEIAIPFKTLRFKQGATKWLINFYRIDSKYNERSTWVPIPRNFQIYSLAYTAELLWDQPLGKPGANWVAIPYLAGGASKDHLRATSVQYTRSVGADAKIAITPALNLDLTFNPDFSQVEVDRQVTNLDRFEIFFPERRQFFLENADLFADFGMNRLRPFFSRRIGVAIDQRTGQNVQNTIHFGARLSGKLGPNWRTGLMTMQAAPDELIGLPSYNYSVAALQRKVFSRSNIGAIFVNKQTFDPIHESDSGKRSMHFHRLAGVDYNIASRNNQWNGKIFFHKSIHEQPKPSSFAHGFNVMYSIPTLTVEWTHQVVGKNYTAPVGFVPRNDFQRIAPRLVYNFFPKSKIVNRLGFFASTDLIWNNHNGLTDFNLTVGSLMRFQNTAEANIAVSRDYILLFRPFDPTNTGGEKLPTGSAYTYYSFSAGYNSSTLRDFYYNLQTYLGQFFNGTRLELSGDVNYRIRPYALLSLDFTFNRLRFPAPYNSANLWLLGPRFDVTFSRSLFLTAFFQYNSQINNININTRLQWRFRPVSDFFLVYTDNYFADVLANKNRAVIAKFTYWLNL
ncbi:MAG: DUF5916 domain-containing protein [Cytophagales bacterium]|nr:DUF5916 domain-containing protein [Cytophagales bacterium]